jgi:D-sedoheptulose 7-phosphate isomerase
MRQTILRNLQDIQSVLNRVIESEALQSTLGDVATRCIEALRGGNKILLAGNGGSAADAQHIAGELVSRFAFDRPGLPAVALTTDTSVLTAIGNDYGYAQLFARQVEALGQRGDVLIAYSTSGNSENIVRGLQVARERGLRTVGLTGAGSHRMDPFCDHLLAVPAELTPRIQEVHLMLGHMLCGLIEQAMFGAGRGG